MQDETTRYPADPGTPETPHEGAAQGEGVRETVGEVAGAVRNEYETLREESLTAARETASMARQQLHDYVDERQSAIAENVQAIADAMQESASSLEAQNRDAVANYWRRAAVGTEDLARWLEGRSAQELWQQGQAYARRQPGLAFGGALAAGFLLARLLKSSAPEAEPRSETYATTNPPDLERSAY
ncbi:MAG: hypothetical protein RQ736_03580 [Thiogranum sp.]|nr:hypothetical protein [Thiogranum sp.]